jgi:hypothetical protein
MPVAPLNRSALTRGAGVVKWNGVYFWTAPDFSAKHAPTWEQISTSMHGRITRFKKDIVIKIPIKLWGAYENIGLLFPTSTSAGQPALFGAAPPFGASLFTPATYAADLPLEIWSRNNDTITYTNAQITKLANLRLGVEADLFEAAVEFTCLVGAGLDPGVSASYYLLGTTAWSDATAGFSSANYLKTRFSGAWGNLTGFSPIYPERGFSIAWDLELEPVMMDGYGTIDYVIKNFLATCKCIPAGPTMANINKYAQADTPVAGVPIGALLSTVVADLTLTGFYNAAYSAAPPVIVLKNCSMLEHSFEFGLTPLRKGEITWETQRVFAGGVPSTTATVV